MTRAVWQFIRSDGTIAIEGPFDDTWAFSDGVANVAIGSKWGLIARDGSFVVEPAYDRVWPSSQRRVAFCVDRKWGFLDPTGEVVIEPRFVEVKNFLREAPLTIVRTDAGWGSMRIDGSFVVPPDMDGIGIGPDGWSRIIKNGLVGFVDENGKRVIEPKFKGVDHFHEDRAVVNIDGKLGYIDRRGEAVIATEYASATDFSCGLALVSKDDRFGFIDASGVTKIPFDFVDAKKFSKTSRGVFAFVLVDEKWRCIDVSGKEISDARFGHALAFEDDTAIASESAKGPFGLVNANLEVVLPMEYDAIDPLVGSHRKISQKRVVGFVDANGAVTIKPRFEDAHPFGEDLAAVRVTMAVVDDAKTIGPITLGDEAPRLRQNPTHYAAISRFRARPPIIDAVIAVANDRAAIRKLLKDGGIGIDFEHAGSFFLAALGVNALDAITVAIEVAAPLPYQLAQVKRSLIDALDQIDSMEATRTRARLFGTVIDPELNLGRALRVLAQSPREESKQEFAQIESNHPGAVKALLALLSGDEAATVKAVATERGIALEESTYAPAEVKKKKKLPDMWTPARFARPLTENRTKALSIHAVDEIAQHLEAEDLDVADLKRVCDAQSLKDFSWSVFVAWMKSGSPPKQKWPFTMLGDFGDDEIVARLAPMIAEWPGQSAHARAVMGLGVLGQIGTDAALRAVHKLSQRAKFGGLKKEAQHVIARIAKLRGLTSEELADQLVPDFDLDDDGSKILDFGKRSFRVGFDEGLRPFVLHDGKRVADLPKAAAGDDKARAAEATTFWKNLKKEVRAIASLQIERLELAMASQRRWHFDAFRAHFIEHPLLQHLAKRLVWMMGKNTFRVAEDGTCAGVKDEAITIEGDFSVGIAHPLEMKNDLGAWSKIFGDYKIVQPFPQIEREIHTIAEEERTSLLMRRFENVEVRGGALVGLLTHGWTRGPVEDGGIYFEISHRLGTLTFKPGLAVGTSANPNQKLSALALTKSDVDPIAFSELIHTLERVKKEP